VTTSHGATRAFVVSLTIQRWGSFGTVSPSSVDQKMTPLPGWPPIPLQRSMGLQRLLEPVIGYSSVDRLIEVLEDKIVRRAEAKFNQLLARRTKQLRVENV
jgi:hypothetical protein